MREIMNVPNVHSGDIVDFEMYDKYLYSRGINESDVKVTQFGYKRIEPPKESIIIPPQPSREIISTDPKPVVYRQNKYETFKRFKIDCSFITGIF